MLKIHGIPRLAIGFLDVVNPSISITRSKHDYWEPSWSEISYTEKEDFCCDCTAKGWKTLSYMYAGKWHDAVFEHGTGEEAYNYFIAHVNDINSDEVNEETLKIWKRKRVN
jgi:hypothetical protein